MSYRWPKETVFEKLVLDVGDRSCPLCGRRMSVCDHRHHRVFTFAGPLHLICRLVHCPDKTCPAHHRTFSPEAEMGIVMPWWVVGWDVFCWITAITRTPSTNPSFARIVMSHHHLASKKPFVGERSCARLAPKRLAASCWPNSKPDISTRLSLLSAR